MSNSAINFKVYCVDNDSNDSEVKRFSVDSHTVTNFFFMEEKLKTVFPNLRNGNFKINWKDGDGDLITISNDEDIITALTEMNYNPKVLYVNVTSKSSDAPNHFRVICDVCQKGITGYRYKCIECPDYDLCATCEGSGNHSEHMVLRFPTTNISFAKVDRKMMHNAARALKKSVSQAHRCARNSFRSGEKEKPSQSGDEASTSGNVPYGCPFTGVDPELLTHNITPLVDMFFKGATTPSNDQAQNSVGDLIRSVVEKFTGPLMTEQNVPSEPSQTSSDQQSNKPETQQNSENKETPVQSKPLNTQPQTSQPSAPSAVPSNNGQDMEWTIVSDSDDSNSQTSLPSNTPTVQPPKPTQDPRLMKGLAQLHEMGFSNENNFLNYMLETNDYNVTKVVKAILQMK